MGVRGLFSMYPRTRLRCMRVQTRCLNLLSAAPNLAYFRACI